MSEITAPEPTLPELPRRDRWIVGTALASLLLHAAVLAFVLWQPLPESAEAAQPPAIDVELVPPPEEASEPPAEEEAGEEGAAGTEAAPPSAPPPQEAASEEAPAEPAAASAPPGETASAQPPAEQSASEEAAAASAEPPEEEAAEPAAEEAAAETAPAEPSQEEAAATAASAAEATGETPSEAEAAAQETPSGTEPAQAASEAVAAAEARPPEAGAGAESEPPQGSVDTAKVAPIPLARPKVRGLTAESGAAEEEAATPSDDVEVAEGTVTADTPAEPDVATLDLGPQRSAQRFYLETMLSTPRMAPAREMLKTLPPDKRLAQTCNIEALAQIGNSGEGFTPDVVMAEAYALSETAGTRLVANGAIFRSQDKWFGVAFDCTLSDDLASVAAFSYRLGADVTEAVLARLNKN